MDTANNMFFRYFRYQPPKISPPHRVDPGIFRNRACSSCNSLRRAWKVDGGMTMKMYLIPGPSKNLRI